MAEREPRFWAHTQGANSHKHPLPPCFSAGCEKTGDTGGVHCWHLATGIHTMGAAAFAPPGHVTEMWQCCRCGSMRTVYVRAPERDRSQDHGIGPPRAGLGEECRPTGERGE